MVISFFSFPYERINHQVFIALMFSIIIGAYHKTFGSRNETINRLVIKSKLPVLIIIIGSLYYSFALFQSEYYVKIIKRYIVEKNYKGMIEYADKAFSSIITLDPISTPIHHYKGEANIKLNKKKQAYKDFQNSVKYFPGHISSLNNLAIMAYELGMEEDAFYYLDQTLDIFPKHQDALYNKSLAYYKSKDYINSYIVYLSCYNQPGKEEKYEMLERSLKMIINGDD